jgi:YhcH/YjgK/YiaL family protein
MRRGSPIIQPRLFAIHRERTSMILDRLDNASRYANLHPLFPAAFDFLNNQRPASLTPGIYPIRGEALFAIVSRQEPGPTPPPLRLEAHRRYIDIQVAVKGAFPCGWRALKDCKTVEIRYSREKDIAFYSDPVDTLLTVGRGAFAIFYPEDAHAPGMATSPLVKVVFKIEVARSGKPQRIQRT